MSPDDAARPPVGPLPGPASLTSTPHRAGPDQLERWHETFVTVPCAPGGEGVHHLIEQQVGRTPDAVAVVLGAQTLSYANLDRRANALAHQLLALGVQRHAMVGVFLERSFEMVVAQLAIWKAGCVYLPLEPDFPALRLHGTLSDSAAAIVLTTAALRGSLPAHTLLLCTDAWADVDSATWCNFPPEPQTRPQTQPQSQPESQTQPQAQIQTPTLPSDACYVIYTSGSTGAPKGAVLPHRAICNHMAWMVAQHGLGADDHVLQKTPFSFDASVWEFLAPLITGARLVLARPGGHRDMPYLARTIIENRVTTLQLVPSVLQLLVDEPGFADCTSLRRVFCGGEALTTALVRRFHAKLPGCELHNLYGPTECCIDTTTYACRADTAALVQPIGHPIWNTSHHVLDEHCQPVAPGDAGELYIGGAGLALGYLNRPQLTAERFVSLTLDAKGPPCRLYRTGDRVRQAVDGCYEFLGRIDFQVKLNGFRIELGEIEAVLETHPQVRQAVTLLREDLPGHKQLVAYVLPAATAQPTPAQLRQHLARLLPSHMLPSACVVLSSLPLTSNGKVDRHALPPPQWQSAAVASSTPVSTSPSTSDSPSPGAPSGAKATAAPRTDTEQQLLDIWGEVLGSRAFDIDDDYFALGGDSLGLMQIGLAIRSRWALDIDPDILFQATTVRALARCLQTSLLSPMLGAADEQAVAPGLAERPVAGCAAPCGLPLTGPVQTDATPVAASLEQQAFWRGARAHPGWPLFNTSEVIGFTRPLDLPALQRAVDTVVERHASLRTALQLYDGQLWQTVWPAAAVCIERVAAAADGLAAVVASLVQTPFHLERGPLSRWVLVSAAPAADTLVLIVHHALTDARTTALVVQDLLHGYEADTTAGTADTAGQESAAQGPALRYADYADSQRRRLLSGSFDAARRYWRQALDPAPEPALTPLRLPSDRPRRAIPRWQGGRVSRVLPAGLCQPLKRLAAARKITLYMALLAALDVLLWQQTGQTDLVVGGSSAGRPAAALNGVAGCFIGALPLRVRLDGSGTWAQLLQQVRRVCLQAYAHQDLPLGMAFESLAANGGVGVGIGRGSLAGAPWPVWLELHDRQHGWETRFGHLGVQRHDIDRGICESELSLEVDDLGTTLVCHAQYKSELFDAPRVQDWLARYEQLLEALVAQTEGPLAAPRLIPLGTAVA